MTTSGSGPSRFFDDMSRLMTNAMGVAQGAKSEAETAMKGWMDRWLADRNLVTREEFEVVREMAIKARSENAELRAMIAAMSGAQGTGGAGPSGAAPVSQADAPPADMTPPQGGPAAGTDTPPVSEAEAPASDMTPPQVDGPALNEPHVSEAEAPATDMTPPDTGDAGGTHTGASETEAPATDMNAGGKH